MTASIELDTSGEVFPWEEKISLTPIADAYVRDGSYANRNFGNTNNLIVKTDNVGYSRKSLIQFSLGAIRARVSSAKLKLTTESTGEDLYRTISVYGTLEDWDESTVVWNDFPKKERLITTIDVDNTPSKGYEVDVTSYINDNIEKEHVSFILVNEAPAGSGTQVVFVSRESQNSHPELVVEQLPYFTVNENVRFYSVTDGTVKPIQPDVSTLPNSDAIKAEIPIMKNYKFSAPVMVSMGLYEASSGGNKLISVDSCSQKDLQNSMCLGQEVVFTTELKIPKDISPENIHVKIFVWNDMEKLNPLHKTIRLRH
jgi:hypothetical protein